MLQFLMDWSHRSLNKPKCFLDNTNAACSSTNTPPPLMTENGGSGSQQPAPIPLNTNHTPDTVSWESWASSLSTGSFDWRDDKHTWSFKDDYISFPCLEPDEHPGRSKEHNIH